MSIAGTRWTLEWWKTALAGVMFQWAGVYEEVAIHTIDRTGAYTGDGFGLGREQGQWAGCLLGFSHEGAGLFSFVKHHDTMG